ncbi:MAG: ABC transporter ATP-binding protein [Gemmataceae bacterium]|nr:ABC transporter ATP-binding protein [Gemmataceae bacterium]
MDAAIECENLTKTYPGKPPVEAVRGISLHIKRGECFGILGPNGAGKTTALELMEGLLIPTSGTVKVLGKTWQKDSTWLREKTGISLQETKLSEELTVLETIRLFASFYQDSADPKDIIAQVSLESKSLSLIGKLSGGQKQRVALACALVGRPELLFLDEPTTGLDPQSRRQVWEMIQKFQAKGGTILITTHYMDEAEKLCGALAIVDQGKIIAQGSPGELLKDFGGQTRIEVDFLEPGPDPQWISPHSEITHMSEVSPNRFLLQTTSLIDSLPKVLAAATLTGKTIQTIRTHQPTLEDVFVGLTGRNLRDEVTGS